MLSFLLKKFSENYEIFQFLIFFYADRMYMYHHKKKRYDQQKLFGIPWWVEAGQFLDPHLVSLYNFLPTSLDTSYYGGWASLFAKGSFKALLIPLKIVTLQPDLPHTQSWTRPSHFIVHPKGILSNLTPLQFHLLIDKDVLTSHFSAIFGIF